MGAAIIAITGVVGIFVLARIIVAVSAMRAAAHQPNGALGQSVGRRTSREWRAFAQAAVERGDFAGAIGALFMAAIMALDETGLIPFDAARTPNEYRRQVNATIAAASTSFDALTLRFVFASFANEPAGRIDYERALAAYQRLAPQIGTA